MSVGGSVQLRIYRQSRRLMSMTDAARVAGISVAEAQLHDEADAIDPPPPEAFEPISKVICPPISTPIAPLSGIDSTTTKEPDMAKPKKSDASGDAKKPDFTRAIEVMRGDIAPAIEDGAKTRGDLSAAWKVIEKDCHCNKAAAKSVNAMLGMTTEKRDDYLRSLYGLMKEAGIGISPDMVDAMGDGEAPKMPVAEKKPLSLHTVN
jgi:hypothetical protein